MFFDFRERGIIKGKIGVVTGNPPFASKLGTEGAERAYARYQTEHGELPDKQVAYLFLHESMEMLERGGVLSMLQQYNFLYNQWSIGFRRKFMERWDVREILDFISVRGLFQKGGADTKVLVVVAEAKPPLATRNILHATFRRTGRVDAEQGFDFDYYGMHGLLRKQVLNNDLIWRTNLICGGRVLALVNRLRKFESLGQYAKKQGWEDGEGFIFGNESDSRPADHVIGKRLLPEEALTEAGIDKSRLTKAPKRGYQWPRRKEIYTPPILLMRENMDLDHDLWTESYLTYASQIFGFGLPEEHTDLAKTLSKRLRESKRILRAFVAASSMRLFCQRSTAISGADVLGLPLLPRDFTLPAHESILVEDIVDYYRDLIRLGEDSAAMKKSGLPALPEFNDVFIDRINAVYKENKLRALTPQTWPGIVCQPYIFGKGEANWSGADELKDKLNKLLKEQRGNINITRIARLYDGAGIYLLKPNRLRYWLRSVALRDADETLADLVEQGF